MKRTPLKRGKSQLKRTPLNQRSKTNKHRHTSVNVYKDWKPCVVCCWLYSDSPELVKGAVTDHEVFHNGSAYMRNMSIEYGASIPICDEHHKQAHANNHNLNNRLKVRFQQQIMEQYELTTEDWISIFGRNYL